MLHGWPWPLLWGTASRGRSLSIADSSTSVAQVKRAGVTNAFVLALDDETKENVEKFGFPVFRMHQKVRWPWSVWHDSL